ncbi:MAG: hypothetical protein IT371_10940 [Deltaproteobacteria bacterium]|nr:hypothetical protein [Deltaproteobacteria bacterium]
MRPALALTAAFLCLATVEPARAAPEHRRYVLIVANNHSLDRGVTPLRYADDDGLRYLELFRLLTPNVQLLTVLDDETARLHPEAIGQVRPPTEAELYATLGRWNAEMAGVRRGGGTAELVFVYAGHGDVDAQGEGYVNLLASRLRRRDLYQRILAPSQASFVHLVIDACKSYFLVSRRGGGWKDDRAADSHEDEVRAFLRREDLSAYPHAGVILATSGDQATHEWTRYRGGILSHELRSALSGAADVNGDGRVEYSELHAFIAAANARVAHPEAKLNIFARPPAANRRQPLVDLRQARAGRLLRFDEGLSGVFHLEDDRGVRVADLHKAAGLRFDVAVDRQRGYFLRHAEREARIGRGSERLAVATLAFSRAALGERGGSLDTTFRRDLYRLAYSRGFYEGFCAQTGHVPVEGSPVEFVIQRPDDASAERHELWLGYQATGALLDLSGAAHGLALRYELGLHRHLGLGATFEYAQSAHDASTGQAFALHRVAALLGATGRLPLGSHVVLKAELALGYQGHFGSGPVMLRGRRIEGSDPLGFRLEAGGALRVRLYAALFAEARGGLGLSVVTVESERLAHAAAYGAVGLGVAF